MTRAQPDRLDPAIGRGQPGASAAAADPQPDQAGRYDQRAVPSIAAPGILLGLGLGGFVDGIVLHQILQWHHMLTSAGRSADTVAGLEANTLADGLFHAATWILATAGLFLLWRAARNGGTAWDSWSLCGWLLVGWGGFNLVEGVVDHHLLAVHHVREGVSGQWRYDVAFLVVGAVLLASGLAVVKRRARALAGRGAAPRG